MRGNPLRICCLISGGGTTAQAIIKACKSGELSHVEVACVIASNEQAQGIQRVLQADIPGHHVLILNPKDFQNPEEFGYRIIIACRDRGIDFIGQYGWLKKTPLNVIEAYKNMMVNQHPGPLDPGYPDFGGKGMFGRRVHQARLFYARTLEQDYWTEATAQRVDCEYDRGALLGMRAVPILKEDDCFALQQRLLPEEHKLQIHVLSEFASGTVGEMRRQKRLVDPANQWVLEASKQEAIKMFPQG